MFGYCQNSIFFLYQAHVIGIVCHARVSSPTVKYYLVKHQLVPKVFLIICYTNRLNITFAQSTLSPCEANVFLTIKPLYHSLVVRLWRTKSCPQSCPQTMYIAIVFSYIRPIIVVYNIIKDSLVFTVLYRFTQRATGTHTHTHMYCHMDV